MAIQSIKYVINRFILRRDTLTAPTPKYGLSLLVKTEDVVGRHLYKYGAHEPETTDFLRENLKLESGDVVFDIGGNIGWYSLILDRMAGEKKDVAIYSFEPDPTNFELLRENIKRNAAKHVTAVQAAVADSKGRMKLHLFGKANRGRHSLLAIHKGETIEINTVTLDGFWAQRELGDRVPRFIKMDIEGFELMALRGGLSVLANCPLVMLEYSPSYMKKAKLQPAELVDLMLEQGFKPHVLINSGLERVSPDELKNSDQHVDLFWKRSR